MRSGPSLEEKLHQIRQIESVIPAVIIIHDIRDTTVFYMSSRGRDILGVTHEELNAMGPEYHSRYFNPEDNKDYGPKIFSLLQSDRKDGLVSYFQQVRAGSEADWSWYLTSTMVFHRDKEGRPTHIISTAIPIDTLHHITAKAGRLLEENNFLRNNYHIFDSLTKREKEILRLMAQGLSSAKMAKTLHISPTTAATHRKNIKKKLQIKNHYDVTKYAQAFNLI